MQKDNVHYAQLSAEHTVAAQTGALTSPRSHTTSASKEKRKFPLFSKGNSKGAKDVGDSRESQETVPLPLTRSQLVTILTDVLPNSWPISDGPVSCRSNLSPVFRPDRERIVSKEMFHPELHPLPPKPVGSPQHLTLSRHGAQTPGVSLKFLGANTDSCLHVLRAVASLVDIPVAKLRSHAQLTAVPRTRFQQIPLSDAMASFSFRSTAKFEHSKENPPVDKFVNPLALAMGPTPGTTGDTIRLLEMFCSLPLSPSENSRQGPITAFYSLEIIENIATLIRKQMEDEAKRRLKTFDEAIEKYKFMANLAEDIYSASAAAPAHAPFFASSQISDLTQQPSQGLDATSSPASDPLFFFSSTTPAALPNTRQSVYDDPFQTVPASPELISHTGARASAFSAPSSVPPGMFPDDVDILGLQQAPSLPMTAINYSSNQDPYINSASAMRSDLYDILGMPSQATPRTLFPAGSSAAQEKLQPPTPLFFTIGSGAQDDRSPHRLSSFPTHLQHADVNFLPRTSLFRMLAVTSPLRASKAPRVSSTQTLAVSHTLGGVPEDPFSVPFRAGTNALPPPSDIFSIGTPTAPLISDAPALVPSSTQLPIRYDMIPANLEATHKEQYELYSSLIAALHDPRPRVYLEAIELLSLGGIPRMLQWESETNYLHALFVPQRDSNTSSTEGSTGAASNPVLNSHGAELSEVPAQQEKVPTAVNAVFSKCVSLLVSDMYTTLYALPIRNSKQVVSELSSPSGTTSASPLVASAVMHPISQLSATLRSAIVLASSFASWETHILHVLQLQAVAPKNRPNKHEPTASMDYGSHRASGSTAPSFPHHGPRTWTDPYTGHVFPFQPHYSKDHDLPFDEGVLQAWVEASAACTILIDAVVAVLMEAQTWLNYSQTPGMRTEKVANSLSISCFTQQAPHTVQSIVGQCWAILIWATGAMHLATQKDLHFSSPVIRISSDIIEQYESAVLHALGLFPMHTAALPTKNNPDVRNVVKAPRRESRILFPNAPPNPIASSRASIRSSVHAFSGIETATKAATSTAAVPPSTTDDHPKWTAKTLFHVLFPTSALHRSFQQTGALLRLLLNEAPLVWPLSTVQHLFHALSDRTLLSRSLSDTLWPNLLSSTIARWFLNSAGVFPTQQPILHATPLHQSLQPALRSIRTTVLSNLKEKSELRKQQTRHGLRVSFQPPLMAGTLQAHVFAGKTCYFDQTPDAPFVITLLDTTRLSSVNGSTVFVPAITALYKFVQEVQRHNAQSPAYIIPSTSCSVHSDFLHYTFQLLLALHFMKQRTRPLTLLPHPYPAMLAPYATTFSLPSPRSTENSTVEYKNSGALSLVQYIKTCVSMVRLLKQSAYSASSPHAYLPPPILPASLHSGISLTLVRFHMQNLYRLLQDKRRISVRVDATSTRAQRTFIQQIPSVPGIGNVLSLCIFHGISDLFPQPQPPSPPLSNRKQGMQAPTLRPLPSYQSPLSTPITPRRNGIERNASASWQTSAQSSLKIGLLTSQADLGQGEMSFFMAGTGSPVPPTLNFDNDFLDTPHSAISLQSNNIISFTSREKRPTNSGYIVVAGHLAFGTTSASLITAAEQLEDALGIWYRTMLRAGENRSRASFPRPQMDATLPPPNSQLDTFSALFTSPSGYEGRHSDAKVVGEKTQSEAYVLAKSLGARETSQSILGMPTVTVRYRIRNGRKPIFSY